MHPLRNIRWLLPIPVILTAALIWRLGFPPEAALVTIEDESGNVPAGSSVAEFQTLFQSTSIDDWETGLSRLSKDESIEMIRRFLASGRNSKTGKQLEIGSDRKITATSSLRAYLLDKLADLDPTAAAIESKTILESPTDADEWAIALRNVALVDASAETRKYLQQKTEELIRNPAWQNTPSAGYLNAFDVLVHTKSVESTPLLSGLIQKKDREDLVHAAFLTLDRLVQLDPQEMLRQLASDRALQQSRPEMTAQQFARADLRDPVQREIVRSWLLDPARSASELTSFASVYPNNNQFVSNNLLTRDTVQSGKDLTAHDKEAIRIIETWQQDATFHAIKPHLANMAARLSRFTNAPSEQGR